MDEKYFEKMAVECVVLNKPLYETVRQIYLDGKRDGAREQLQECKKGIEGIITYRFDCVLKTIKKDEVLAALDAAAIKEEA